MAEVLEVHSVQVLRIYSYINTFYSVRFFFLITSVYRKMGNFNEKTCWHKSMHQDFVGNVFTYEVTEPEGQRPVEFWAAAQKFLEIEQFTSGTGVEFHFSGITHDCDSTSYQLAYVIGDDHLATGFALKFADFCTSNKIPLHPWHTNVEIYFVMGCATVTYK